MPITKIPSFQTTDGKTFAGLGEAQAHELCALFEPVPENVGSLALADLILSHRDNILAILSSTGRKQRTRKAGTKTRKPKEAVPA